MWNKCLSLPVPAVCVVKSSLGRQGCPNKAKSAATRTIASFSKDKPALNSNLYFPDVCLLNKGISVADNRYQGSVFNHKALKSVSRKCLESLK